MSPCFKTLFDLFDVRNSKDQNRRLKSASKKSFSTREGIGGTGSHTKETGPRSLSILSKQSSVLLRSRSLSLSLSRGWFGWSLVALNRRKRDWLRESWFSTVHVWMNGEEVCVNLLRKRPTGPKHRARVETDEAIHNVERTSH